MQNSSWLVLCLYDANKRLINGSDGTLFSNLKKVNALKDRVNSKEYVRLRSLGAEYISVLTHGEWIRKSPEQLEKLELIPVDKFQR